MYGKSTTTRVIGGERLVIPGELNAKTWTDYKGALADKRYFFRCRHEDSFLYIEDFYFWTSQQRHYGLENEYLFSLRSGLADVYGKELQTPGSHGVTCILQHFLKTLESEVRKKDSKSNQKGQRSGHRCVGSKETKSRHFLEGNTSESRPHAREGVFLEGSLFRAHRSPGCGLSQSHNAGLFATLLRNPTSKEAARSQDLPQLERSTSRLERAVRGAKPRTSTRESRRRYRTPTWESNQDRDARDPSRDQS